jgi:hypothetical protein
MPSRTMIGGNSKGSGRLPADIPTSHKREGEDQRDQSRVALSMPARNADLGSS